MLLTVFSLTLASMSATPAAFPATAPGLTELKTLPAGILLRSETKGEYFEKSGDLFRPLFRYIQRKDIAMTTPVESHMGETSAMYFWVATSERPKAEVDLAPASAPVPEGVVVLKRAEQLVASHGGRGGYSRKHFEEARDAVVAWVASQADLAITGEAYGVYWSSPFTLPFMKRYEVHVPVRRLTAKTGG